MADHEAELENFRQKWREEVKQRKKPRSGPSQGSAVASTSAASANSTVSRKPAPPPVAASTGPAQARQDDGSESRAFHDIEDKEDALKLKNQDIRGKARESNWQPKSALEHYEKAVETESEGKLGDSVGLYRKAFKLDSGVHEAYKQKHFPPSSFVASKPQQTNPSNASPTVPNPAHHSLQGSEQGNAEVTLSLTELIDSFAKFSIPPAEPETSLSKPPPCPISEIPDEILAELISTVALSDVASLSKLATVCKRLAYFVEAEDSIWKRVCFGREFGFTAMHYTYTCDLHGQKLIELPFPGLRQPIPPPLDLVPARYSTYRAQFRHRPRIRFGGCYISTVNYTRQGAASQDQRTWASPIHIVTYYRYLRFFRNGRVISLLTTAEPRDVVHHITWENIQGHHGQGMLPGAVMKDALPGRWRLSGATLPDEFEKGADESKAGDFADFEAPGPGFYNHEPNASFPEPEGELFIETIGVVPKYMWKMHFSLGSSGRKDGARNNRLTWKGFWSYDHLADDWGEFGLKNYRAFYWSRVKSYSLGLE